LSPLSGETVGKPYSKELDNLPLTYGWAMAEPIGPLVRSVRGLGGFPLVAVGSGGSYTVAQVACDLHRQHTGRHAQTLTPLQAVSSPVGLRGAGVLMPTAGGKNPDVLGAFRALVVREPRQLLVLCANPGSLLSRAASLFHFVDRHEHSPPCGKDGFLAVNSLLGFALLLARAYAGACGTSPLMPPTYADLLGSTDDWQPGKLDDRCATIWQRDTLLVLHGPSTQVGAIDLESKCTEAALTNVQTADFRHFAHGRHHWLAKRGDRTAVLALCGEEDSATSDRTLSLLPGSVPVLRVEVPHRGWTAGLAALARCFHLVGSLGRARAIDPGDPGVPPFGRRIYRLDVYRGASVTGGGSADEVVAIERKSGAAVETLAVAGSLSAWRDALARFRSRLAGARFRGVVLDYDGTLCSEAERRGPLPDAPAKELERLLRAGAVIGVATGRGKSVRASLQATIPSRWWAKVIIGYYNGAEVGTLDDDTRPDGSEQVCEPLRPLAALLRSSPLLLAATTCTFRPRQITIEPADGATPWGLWDRVQQLVLSLPSTGAVALRSGHSVDVVAPGVSKLAVVERVRQAVGAGWEVLCIGDRGRWPGNDHALLATPCSLSADEVSADPAACWNLAPAGHRGLQATLGYLHRLNRRGDFFTFDGSGWSDA
jgi:fructoselysine-6-P-deglycase FrlB-like protein